jgi:2-polyprenyl-3-methyl-5-hydroxy-6-metoxy-1,4-benzoquinol methylase
MKHWALDFLGCPITSSPLRLVDPRVTGDEIVAGHLVSPEGRRYEIIDGVPRFAVVENLETQSAKSVESFGFEWNTLNFDLFHANWMEHIVVRNFESPQFFRGKVVLDCGSGSGMHSRWMIEAGAARVISLELSSTVDGIMRKNLSSYSDRNLIVQCDIANPPVQKGKFDVLYCMNVIQHTKDPAVTTRNLYRLVGDGQELYINYYRMPEAWWKQLRIILGESFRRNFTAKLPKAVLLNLIRAASLATYVPLLDRIALQFLICGEVPPGPQFRARRYRQTVLNTYDWFGSHDFQYHYRCWELLSLFAKAEIKYDRIPNLEQVMRLALPGLAFRFVGDGGAGRQGNGV